MVTTLDIANEFEVSCQTVRSILAPSSKTNSERAIEIRNYAKKMGYMNNLFRKQCTMCGTTFIAKGKSQKYCHECGIKAKAERNKKDLKAYRIRQKAKKYWHNGCFHTQEEEVKRMKQLRSEGYSNAEIAKKIGRAYDTVRRVIGSQPNEMTRQNIAIGKKIQAQKNAARKQYVINQPIIEYNRKVEELNKVKEELDALQKDISVKQKTAETNARKTVKAPSIVLTTTQIAG